jgi:hypothetical protein
MQYLLNLVQRPIYSLFPLSFPRLNLLRPRPKSAPNQTVATARLLRIGRLNFPVVQPLPGKLLVRSSTSIHVPQYQVLNILELAVSQ